MRDYDDRRPNPQETDLGSAVRATARLAATAFGILLMLVGAYFTIKLIGVGFEAFSSSDEVGGMVDFWEKTLGEESLVVNKEAVKVDGARILAVVLLGCLATLVGWLSLSLITAGAKVVQITTTDKETIRRVIKEVFGRDAEQ